jgi:hypothetical protein
MNLLLKLLLGLFLFSNSLKAQEIKLTQTLNGEVLLIPVLPEFYWPNRDKINFLSKFTDGTLAYNLIKQDSVILFYDFKDSVKTNINNRSFQFFEDINNDGSLFLKQRSIEEKYFKQGIDSFVYAIYDKHFCSGFRSFGMLFEIHFITSKNKIIKVDIYRGVLPESDDCSTVKSETILLEYNKKGMIKSVRYFNDIYRNWREEQYKYRYDKSGRLSEFTNKSEFTNLKIRYYYADNLLTHNVITYNGSNERYTKKSIRRLIKADKKKTLKELHDFNKLKNKDTKNNILEKHGYSKDSLITLIREKAKKPDNWWSSFSCDEIFRYSYLGDKLSSISLLSYVNGINESGFIETDTIVYDHKGRIVLHAKYDGDFEYLTEYSYNELIGKLINKKCYPISENSKFNEKFEEWYKYNENGRMKAIKAIEYYDNNVYPSEEFELHLRYLD